MGGREVIQYKVLNDCSRHLGRLRMSVCLCVCVSGMGVCCCRSPQYTTSYTVAFLSPEPVTMNLSSGETSQLSTDEDSFDWNILAP